MDLVERDVLLRKIKVEIRDLNRELADLALQKSLLKNDVGQQDDTEDEAYENEEAEAQEIEAEDVQELDEARTGEYNRLHNFLSRTKSDIKSRKEKIRNPTKRR